VNGCYTKIDVKTVFAAVLWQIVNYCSLSFSCCNRIRSVICKLRQYFSCRQTPNATGWQMNYHEGHFLIHSQTLISSKYFAKAAAFAQRKAILKKFLVIIASDISDRFSVRFPTNNDSIAPFNFHKVQFYLKQFETNRRASYNECQKLSSWTLRGISHQPVAEANDKLFAFGVKTTRCTR
jgi:hypothetical protein